MVGRRCLPTEAGPAAHRGLEPRTRDARALQGAGGAAVRCAPWSRARSRRGRTSFIGREREFSTRANLYVPKKNSRRAVHLLGSHRKTSADDNTFGRVTT